GLVELGGTREPRWTGTDHGYILTGTLGGRFGHDPVLLKALVDDGAFNVLDGHRRFVDAQNARAFARCGTDPAGEFREVIRLVQPLERFAPQSAINEIVPFGNEVIDRTARGHARDQRAGVTKGNAAVHAA